MRIGDIRVGGTYSGPNRDVKRHVVSDGDESVGNLSPFDHDWLTYRVVGCPVATRIDRRVGSLHKVSLRKFAEWARRELLTY